MRVANFDFDLPRERIAVRPISPRDAARLLVVSDQMSDRSVRDLPSLLEPGDVMVLNDTRVLPARLSGRRGEARIDITLHRHVDGAVWLAFARPAKRLRPGESVVFGADFSAEVMSRRAGEVRLRFNCEGAVLGAALARYGRAPLPPYISRDEGPDSKDGTDYQTIYAVREGAVAAPTAGLHFSSALFQALDDRGIQRAFVTLHVGAGTYLPVTVDDTDDHRMHGEWGEVDAEAVLKISGARKAGKRVVAVGSTSLRLLEWAADESGQIAPFKGEVDLFIVPGYGFKVVDMMLTNFHLPRSTLFMLVCAFAGTERMKTAYSHAIHAGYRFYSYGDACLLGRQEDR